MRCLLVIQVLQIDPNHLRRGIQGGEKGICVVSGTKDVPISSAKILPSVIPNRTCTKSAAGRKMIKTKWARSNNDIATINGNNPCRLPSIIQREHGFRQGIKGNIRVMFRKNSRPMIFICRKCSCFFSIRRSTIQILGYDIIGKGSSTDCNAGINSRINRLNTKRKADHC